MIGHQMTFLDPALFMFRQLAKHLSEVLAQLLVERSAPALRDKHHMIFSAWKQSHKQSITQYVTI